MSAISASPVEPAILPFGSLEWFKRQLASTPNRARRTAIMVGAAVLCVIISMTLQVPELSVTAYMPFFVSQETKLKTIVVGVGGFIGLTIGIGLTLLLYKFTYGYPELRIPGMAIALFLGMWLSRVFVIGALGFLIGFIVAVSQSVGEAVPSSEQLVRDLLWLWVAIAYGVGLTVVLNLLFLPGAPGPPAHLPKPKGFFVSDAFTNPAHVHFALKVTFAAIAGWVATGSERISYAGLQLAFAFFYSVFQGYAPDTDLDNVRNRVVGILFGLVVTGLVFQYIWPERASQRNSK